MIVLVDDHGFGMVEDFLKVVVFEERVGVVRSEALFSAGSFRKIPGVGGGGRGHAAEEAGELAWSAEAGVLFVDELTDEGEVILGDFGYGRGGEFSRWLVALAA